MSVRREHVRKTSPLSLSTANAEKRFSVRLLFGRISPPFQFVFAVCCVETCSSSRDQRECGKQFPTKEID